MSEVLWPVYRPGGKAADGTPIDVSASSVRVVSFRGASTLLSGQFDVTTITRLVVGSDPLRRTITIYNVGANDIYYGGKGVTISNGYKIAANKERTLELAGELYAVTAATTEKLLYIMETDQNPKA